MGVADITLSQAITQQLNQQELSIANLEEQVSSGRSLNKPSDNPAAVTQVLQLSSQASQLSNWQANAQTATSWLGMGNDALNSVLDDMQSFQLIVNFLIQPMFFLSGALFPLTTVPGAIKVVSAIDPLSYGVDGVRGALSAVHYYSYGLDLRGAGFPYNFLVPSTPRTFGISGRYSF